MKNLLKFEFRKLLKQKSLYICTLASVLMFTLMFVIKVKELQNMGAAMPSVANSMLNAISSATFTMICGIFVVLYTCTDYDNQTIKNVYARGFSRTLVYFAKYIVSIIAMLAMLFVVFLVGFIESKIYFTGETEQGNYVGLFIGQLLYCIANTSFVFAITIMLKKVGVSIAIAVLGPELINMLLSLVDTFLKLDKFKLSSYWFENFLSDLSNVATTNTRIAVCISVSVAYIALFVFLGYFVNKKSDS